MESLDNDSNHHDDTIMVVEEETVLVVASTVEESMSENSSDDEQFPTLITHGKMTIRASNNLNDNLNEKLKLIKSLEHPSIRGERLYRRNTYKNLKINKNKQDEYDKIMRNASDFISGIFPNSSNFVNSSEETFDNKYMKREEIISSNNNKIQSEDIAEKEEFTFGTFTSSEAKTAQHKSTHQQATGSKAKQNQSKKVEFNLNWQNSPENTIHTLSRTKHENLYTIEETETLQISHIDNINEACTLIGAINQIEKSEQQEIKLTGMNVNEDCSTKANINDQERLHNNPYKTSNLCSTQLPTAFQASYESTFENSFIEKSIEKQYEEERDVIARLFNEANNILHIHKDGEFGGQIAKLTKHVDVIPSGIISDDIIYDCHETCIEKEYKIEQELLLKYQEMEEWVDEKEPKIDSENNASLIKMDIEKKLIFDSIENEYIDLLKYMNESEDIVFDQFYSLLETPGSTNSNYTKDPPFTDIINHVDEKIQPDPHKESLIKNESQMESNECEADMKDIIEEHYVETEQTIIDTELALYNHLLSELDDNDKSTSNFSKTSSPELLSKLTPAKTKADQAGGLVFPISMVCHTAPNYVARENLSDLYDERFILLPNTVMTQSSDRYSEISHRTLTFNESVSEPLTPKYDKIDKIKYEAGKGNISSKTEEIFRSDDMIRLKGEDPQETIFSKLINDEKSENQQKKPNKTNDNFNHYLEDNKIINHINTDDTEKNEIISDEGYTIRQHEVKWNQESSDEKDCVAKTNGIEIQNSKTSDWVSIPIQIESKTKSEEFIRNVPIIVDKNTMSRGEEEKTTEIIKDTENQGIVAKETMKTNQKQESLGSDEVETHSFLIDTNDADNAESKDWIQIPIKIESMNRQTDKLINVPIFVQGKTIPMGKEDDDISIVKNISVDKDRSISISVEEKPIPVDKQILKANAPMDIKIDSCRNIEDHEGWMDVPIKQEIKGNSLLENTNIAMHLKDTETISNISTYHEEAQTEKDIARKNVTPAPLNTDNIKFDLNTVPIRIEQDSEKKENMNVNVNNQEEQNYLQLNESKCEAKSLSSCQSNKNVEVTVEDDEQVIIKNKQNEHIGDTQNTLAKNIEEEERVESFQVNTKELVDAKTLATSKFDVNDTENLLNDKMETIDSNFESERKKCSNKEGNIYSTLHKAIFQLDKTVNVFEIHQDILNICEKEEIIPEIIDVKKMLEQITLHESNPHRSKNGKLEMQGLNEKDTNTIRFNQHQAKEKIEIPEDLTDRTTSEDQDERDEHVDITTYIQESERNISTHSFDSNINITSTVENNISSLSMSNLTKESHGDNTEKEKDKELGEGMNKQKFEKGNDKMNTRQETEDLFQKGNSNEIHEENNLSIKETEECYSEDRFLKSNQTEEEIFINEDTKQNVIALKQATVQMDQSDNFCADIMDDDETKNEEIMKPSLQQEIPKTEIREKLPDPETTLVIAEKDYKQSVLYQDLNKDFQHADIRVIDPNIAEDMNCLLEDFPEDKLITSKDGKPEEIIDTSMKPPIPQTFRVDEPLKDKNDVSRECLISRIQENIEVINLYERRIKCIAQTIIEHETSCIENKEHEKQVETRNEDNAMKTEQLKTKSNRLKDNSFQEQIGKDSLLFSLLLLLGLVLLYLSDCSTVPQICQGESEGSHFSPASCTLDGYLQLASGAFI